MKTYPKHLFLALLLGAGAGLGTGCQTRLHLTTGTVIGLHANPGDGQTQPPQVTFAYKRAELAVVPTAGKQASNDPASDAFSALALIDFKTKFFGATALDQFIATGMASREIQTNGSPFAKVIAREMAQGALARVKVENTAIASLVKAVDDGNGKVDGTKLAALAKGTPLEGFAPTYAGKSTAEWDAFLKADGRPFVEDLQKNLR